MAVVVAAVLVCPGPAVRQPARGTTWRCRACGIAWPCPPAKLRLLGERFVGWAHARGQPGRVVDGG
ncbi:hypothetical protein O7606_23470 [Micromonospora sp. WMMD882]|uniref:hypothetical protein n=1 Tax=Micromonospora sp. WMMD882 TaxID=3015151 RepID=UPI00248C624D|nr:hypothetical protein [Micromonospora sp. WMMD882]WBB79110.1 hypothetical protein O7606_23470 [Micromonospora sp. WMMD882]